MATDPKLIEILNATRMLSTEDKIQLIRSTADQLERDLKGTKKIKGKSLRGLWKGLGITEKEIDENRREVWRNFPREIT